MIVPKERKRELKKRLMEDGDIIYDLVIARVHGMDILELPIGTSEDVLVAVYFTPEKINAYYHLFGGDS